MTDDVTSNCLNDNPLSLTLFSKKDPEKVVSNSQIQELQSESSNLDITPTADDNTEHSDSLVDDTDEDPDYVPDSHVRICEVSGCQVEIFSSCHVCGQLLCYDHFVNTGPCENDHKATEPVNSKKKCVELRPMTIIPVENIVPEDFMVDGSQREEEVSSPIKKKEIRM